jgi:hypothetical protein
VSIMATLRRWLGRGHSTPPCTIICPYPERMEECVRSARTEESRQARERERREMKRRVDRIDEEISILRRETR